MENMHPRPLSLGKGTKKEEKMKKVVLEAGYDEVFVV